MARILAVDDEIDVLIAVRSVLEDDGHTGRGTKRV
jgi:hypothetical protein